MASPRHYTRYPDGTWLRQEDGAVIPPAASNRDRQQAIVDSAADPTCVTDYAPPAQTTDQKRSAAIAGDARCSMYAMAKIVEQAARARWTPITTAPAAIQAFVQGVVDAETNNP